MIPLNVRFVGLYLWSASPGPQYRGTAADLVTPQGQRGKGGNVVVDFMLRKCAAISPSTVTITS